mmetsp:Transcript_4578/g.12841  ORF Transcript_4578/g.12841 Transcript_4578/m.12841 type:complete len:297 (-) Transcript_4578:523-1413(-)
MTLADCCGTSTRRCGRGCSATTPTHGWRPGAHGRAPAARTSWPRRSCATCRCPRSAPRRCWSIASSRSCRCSPCASWRMPTANAGTSSSPPSAPRRTRIGPRSPPASCNRARRWSSVARTTALSSTWSRRSARAGSSSGGCFVSASSDSEAAAISTSDRRCWQAMPARSARSASSPCTVVRQWPSWRTAGQFVRTSSAPPAQRGTRPRRQPPGRPVGVPNAGVRRQAPRPCRCWGTTRLAGSTSCKARKRAPSPALPCCGPSRRCCPSTLTSCRRPSTPARLPRRPWSTTSRLWTS